MDKAILKARDVFVSHGNRSIISGLSFSLRPGEITGLIGRNGAGKTTLLKALMGINALSAGSIIFEGHELLFPDDYASITFIADRGQFYPFWNAIDNLKFFSPSNVAADEIMAALQAVDLQTDAKKKVSTYSFGMLQRLNIARGILCKPKVLIMDEPLNGIDPLGTRLLRNTLQVLIERYGTSVLMSSNSLKEMESFCENYLFMRDGRIVETVEQIDDASAFNGFIDLSELVEVPQWIKLFIHNGQAVEIGSLNRVYLCMDGSLTAMNETLIHSLPAKTSALEDIYFALQRTKRSHVAKKNETSC